MAKHKYKILIGVIALIFVCGVVFLAAALFAPSKSVVNITRDGELLYSFDLGTTDDQTFVIEYENSSNTVEIKDGKIRISEAECPDGVCVRTGWLSSSAIPIVCLPNHLVINFADENSEVDAVVG